MHVLGLVKSVDHVCCRYRLAAFQSLLSQAGHDLELRAWPRSWFGRLWLYRRLRQADLVIVQRRLLAPWEMLVVRRAARRLVFDVDDAIFLRDSYASAGLASRGRLNGFTRMVRAADLIVAGNDFLGDRAAAEVGAARVRIVPTCVDPTRYPLARHQRIRAGVRLVWIGSASTLQGLELAAPLWEEIGRRCPGVRLKIICDQGLSFTHLPIEFCPWSEATEGVELARADIGVSWLPDDQWSRGKCGLKVLQYMAAGLPVVANPVGVQVDLVRHGKTGFLAQTPSQWAAAITRLADDPDLRRKMGREGRRVVETDYSVAAAADNWVAVLEHLAEPVPHAVEVGA
jgi:glycosyltransferase involved in cell wall biosynthesis